MNSDKRILLAGAAAALCTGVALGSHLGFGPLGMSYLTLLMAAVLMVGYGLISLVRHADRQALVQAEANLVVMDQRMAAIRDSGQLPPGTLAQLEARLQAAHARISGMQKKRPLA